VIKDAEVKGLITPNEVCVLLLPNRRYCEILHDLLDYPSVSDIVNFKNQMILLFLYIAGRSVHVLHGCISDQCSTSSAYISV
jgi:hypothetical protein